MNKGDLDFNTTIILDKIQKNKIDEIDKKDLKKLREQRLIEKIGKEYILSSKVAEIIGKEAEYTEKKGFEDDYIIEKIIKHLKNFEDGLKRNKINDFAWKYLPGVLSDEQKYEKIQRILTNIKNKGIIEKINGTTRGAIWRIKKE